MRKVQFGFGWDWGPRLRTVGIWRPIDLRRALRVTFRSVHFYALDIDPKGERAAVAVRSEVERFANARPIEAAVTFTAPEGTSVAESTLVLDGEETNLSA